jgi:hypothetical protein
MSDTPVPENVPASQPPVDDSKLIQKQRRVVLMIVGAGIVLLGLLILVVVLLMNPRMAGTVSQIRDVFIIFMAFESLVIGITLVILIVQIATLINLLQNEIKPILNSTNETVNTLRGTAAFLSDNLAEPVIKLNEYLAGLKRLIDLVRIPRH